MPLMHNRFEGRAMEIVPIKTNRDDRRTLKEIEGLMTAKRNTPEGDRLDVLVTLIESWEARNHPLDLPDPIAAIHYHMEQKGLAAKDLAPYIGSRNRVYEVLNPLSLKRVISQWPGQVCVENNAVGQYVLELQNARPTRCRLLCLGRSLSGADPALPGASQGLPPSRL